jgi:hypothetical protein
VRRNISDKCIDKPANCSRKDRKRLAQENAARRAAQKAAKAAASKKRNRRGSKANATKNKARSKTKSKTKSNTKRLSKAKKKSKIHASTAVAASSGADSLHVLCSAASGTITTVAANTANTAGPQVVPIAQRALSPTTLARKASKVLSRSEMFALAWEHTLCNSNKSDSKSIGTSGSSSRLPTVSTSRKVDTVPANQQVLRRISTVFHSIGAALSAELKHANETRSAGKNIAHAMKKLKWLTSNTEQLQQAATRISNCDTSSSQVIAASGDAHEWVKWTMLDNLITDFNDKKAYLGRMPHIGVLIRPLYPSVTSHATWVNEAMRIMLDWPIEDTQHGLDTSKHVGMYPADSMPSIAAHFACMSTHKKEHSTTMRPFQKADGTVIAAMLSERRVYGPDGQVLWFEMYVVPMPVQPTDMQQWIKNVSLKCADA